MSFWQVLSTFALLPLLDIHLTPSVSVSRSLAPRSTLSAPARSCSFFSLSVNYGSRCPLYLIFRNSSSRPALRSLFPGDKEHFQSPLPPKALQPPQALIDMVARGRSPLIAHMRRFFVSRARWQIIFLTSTASTPFYIYFYKFDDRNRQQ